MTARQFSPSGSGVLMVNSPGDQPLETSDAAWALGVSPGEVALPVDAIEMLTALLANGRACQNWLSPAHPNLDGALLSVTRIIRDAQRLSNIILQIRSIPAG